MTSKQLSRIEQARGNMNSARRALEEAIERFQKASYEYHQELQYSDNSGTNNLNAIINSEKLHQREAKGQVEAAVALYLLAPEVGLVRFKEIKFSIEQTLKRNVAESTLRHTLNRMHKKSLVEKHASLWKEGALLRIKRDNYL